MGWTFTHREHGISDLDFFQKEWPSIIALKSPSPSVSYAAVKLKGGHVIGLVILKRRKKNDRYNFGWKEMDETMGPCESQCPKSILDLLTPIDPSDPEMKYLTRFATEWRADCRRNLALQKRMRRYWKGLKRGDYLQVAKPVSYGRRGEVKVFRLHSKRPYRYVACPEGGREFLCTISKRMLVEYGLDIGEV